MNKPSFNDVKKALRSKGYPIFGNRDFDITLFGIRTNIGGATGQSLQTDKFDDWLGAIWREHGSMQMVIVEATTDPGLAILKSPVNSAGTAIMVPDHYKGLWTQGRHSKITNAFRQSGNVTVWRDRDRDNYLDMGPSVKKETGSDMWINLHPATYRVGGSASQVGRWSAGCQVTKTWNDFAKLRDLRDEQLKRWGTSVTSYSLLTAKDF
jgi:hypothetical protein